MPKNPWKELKRGLRKSTPSHMVARAASGGRHQTVGAWVRSYGKPISTHRMADEQKLTAAQRRVAPSERGRAGAAKKTAGKRPNAYEAAAKIPARNQAAAKKNAAAAKKAGKGTASGRVQIPKRNPDGTFNGSVSSPSFGPREQAIYERQLAGWVDPAQQVRQPRRRK